MAKSNPVRFSTKYQDDETDLFYYGRRHYNASIGRWLSRDPVDEKGGKNLYGFVGNNPINFVDLLGLTIPGGPASYNYPPYVRCACKCGNVKVTYEPGARNKFQWGWKAPVTEGATARYGDDMKVVWSVEGSPFGCDFYQDESNPKNFFGAVRTDPPSSKKQPPWKNHKMGVGEGSEKDVHYGDSSFSYVDPIGVNFRSGDEGEWNIGMDFKAVLKCVSSDSSSKSQEVSLSDFAIINYPAK